MKLGQNKIDVEGGFGIKSYDADIDMEQLNKLYDIVLQNPYKNNIGAIVREISSNIFDSHAEAGVTDPGVIRFDTTDSGYSIIFKDVGVGLSPERIDTVYRKYLKSTKEHTNDMLGAFGLGSKSPLSYQSYFTIITIHNNIMYKYIMRKNATKPSIDLISEEPTTERNGTEIILDIKNQKDLESFIKETYSQLYYLNNVVIDYANIIDQFPTYSYGNNITQDKLRDYLNQDYKIIEGKYFYCRIDNNPFAPNKMHLSIGNVKYPIDWDNIGLRSNDYDINLGLKFDIGDLSIPYTREDIYYIDENITKIKDKIELVKEELTQLLNKQTSEVDTIDGFIKILKEDSYFINILNQFIPKSLINYDNLTLPSYKNIQFKDSIEYQQFITKIRNSYSILRLSIPSLKKRNTNGSYVKTNSISPQNFHNSLFGVNDYSIYKLEELLYKLKGTSDKFAVKSGDISYNTLKNKYLDDLGCDFIIGKPKLKVIKAEYKRKTNKNYRLLIEYLSESLLEEFKGHSIDYDTLVVPDSFKPVKQVNTTFKPKNTFKVQYLKYYGGGFASAAYNLGEECKDDYFTIDTLNQVIAKTGKDKFAILISSEDLNKYKKEEYTFFRLIGKATPVVYIVSPTNYNKLLKEPNRNFITIKEYFNIKKMKYKVIPEFIAYNKFIEDNPEFSSDYFFNSFINLIDLPIFKKDTKLQEVFGKIRKYKVLFADDKFKELTEELTEGFKDIKLDTSFKEELQIINKFKEQKLGFFQHKTSYSSFLNFLDVPLEETFIKDKRKQKEYLVEDIFKDSITLDNFEVVLKRYYPYQYSEIVTEEQEELFKTDKEEFKKYLLDKIKYLLFNTNYLDGKKLIDYELVNYYIKNK